MPDEDVIKKVPVEIDELGTTALDDDGLLEIFGDDTDTEEEEDPTLIDDDY